MRNPASELARRRDKPLVDAWIKSVIDADAARGRSHAEFPGGDAEQRLRRAVPALNAAGFDVYQGAGNVFQARHAPGGPVVVHTRPWAQRIVRLAFR
jgi:hypothetical protein